MGDAVVEADKRVSNLPYLDDLDHGEPTQEINQLYTTPPFELESIPIPLPKSEDFMFQPTTSFEVEETENARILKAKQELSMLKAGHKRKMEIEFKFGTPQKKRMRKTFSGPPSVETSPLTPSRKEKIRNIRQVLFAKNLSQALEEEASRASISNNVSIFPGNNEESSQLVQLENQQLFIQLPDKQLIELRNDQIIEIQDEQFVNNGPLQIDSKLLMDFMKENAPSDWSFAFDEEGKALLKNMISYVCEDGGNPGCVEEATDNIASESILHQNGAIQEDAETIQNEESVAGQEIAIPSNSNERYFYNPRTKTEENTWFEKPATSTTYHDVLSNRDEYRFMIFKLAEFVKGLPKKKAITKIIRVVLRALGYNEEQLKTCFDLTRAMFYRFFSQSLEKCQDQFKLIMQNESFLREFDKTIGAVFKKVI